MSSIDDQGRVEPETRGDEFETLIGFLEFQRSTFAWKCSGLDATGLAATVAASTMTLGGLYKHLAYVEDDWFTRHLLGEDTPEPWASVDWDADPDWEWRTAGDDGPEELRALWDRSVQRSRDAVAEAMAGDGLDMVASGTKRNGFHASLRWILVHMIEEYARHNGHADLIRESIDGSVGE